MPASKAWGAVPLTLNGERHQLKYVSMSWSVLEEKFGLTFDSLVMNNGLTVGNLDKMVWAGLLHETRGELTWEDFGWEFDTREITERTEELMETVAKALGVAAPEAEKSDKVGKKAEEANGVSPLPATETETAATAG